MATPSRIRMVLPHSVFAFREYPGSFPNRTSFLSISETPLTRLRLLIKHGLGLTTKKQIPISLGCYKLSVFIVSVRFVYIFAPYVGA